MTALQCNLSDPAGHYGCDLMVAVTQASVNSTIKAFIASLSNGEAPEVVVCAVLDKKNIDVGISYEDLKARANGSDPFNPKGQTDQDLKNLRHARFSGAFRARIGPPKARPENWPSVVTLSAPNDKGETQVRFNADPAALAVPDRQRVHQRIRRPGIYRRRRDPEPVRSGTDLAEILHRHARAEPAAMGAAPFAGRPRERRLPNPASAKSLPARRRNWMGAQRQRPGVLSHMPPGQSRPIRSMVGADHDHARRRRHFALPDNVLHETTTYKSLYLETFANLAFNFGGMLELAIDQAEEQPEVLALLAFAQGLLAGYGVAGVPAACVYRYDPDRQH